MRLIDASRDEPMSSGREEEEWWREVSLQNWLSSQKQGNLLSAEGITHNGPVQHCLEKSPKGQRFTLNLFAHLLFTGIII